MRRILVQALSENMYSPAVGLKMTTGETVPLSALVGMEFTGYFMTNPALVGTLQDRGIDAKLTETEEELSGESAQTTDSGFKVRIIPKKVYVQDPGDEIYVIRGAEGDYIWQHRRKKRLPKDFTFICKKYVIVP